MRSVPNSLWAILLSLTATTNDLMTLLAHGRAGLVSKSYRSRSFDQGTNENSTRESNWERTTNGTMAQQCKSRCIDCYYLLFIVIGADSLWVMSRCRLHAVPACWLAGWLLYTVYELWSFSRTSTDNPRHSSSSSSSRENAISSSSSASRRRLRRRSSRHDAIAHSQPAGVLSRIWYQTVDHDERRLSSDAAHWTRAIIVTTCYGTIDHEISADTATQTTHQGSSAAEYFVLQFVSKYTDLPVCVCVRAQQWWENIKSNL